MTTKTKKKAAAKAVEPATRPVGRPPNKEFTKRSPIRHTPEQYESWTQAAQLDNRSFQSWVRKTLDDAAKALRPTAR